MKTILPILTILTVIPLTTLICIGIVTFKDIKLTIESHEN